MISFKLAMWAFVAVGLVAPGWAVGAAQAQTLDTVKKRGILNCGVNVSLAGFSAPDDKGNWTGLDVDFCKAIAVAVLGDETKIKFVPTTAKERFEALKNGEVDILARNTTWSMSRDTKLAMMYGPVNYYDGQGFMVKKALGVKFAKELKGATICVQSGTTTELNLADFFRANKIDYKTVVFDKADEAMAAYSSGRCDAFTTDGSGLLSERLKLAKPDDHIILPELISKEPLGPAVRQGDIQWFNIVKWTHYAMLTAEELGVTSKNLDEMAASTNPEIKRLLGKEGEFGKDIGLGIDWAANIIKVVGNYGESFERNVGAGSRLNIARGLNALYINGGLQYAPPIR